MRIAPYHPGPQPSPYPLPDASLAPASGRDTRGSGNRARLPITRVYEGEIVPRPLAAERLLDGARRAPLAAAAATDVTPSAASRKTLFYVLHSSDERLAATTLGSHIDQFA